MAPFAHNEGRMKKHAYLYWWTILNCCVLVAYFYWLTWCLFQGKKGVWIKLPIELVHLVQAAVEVLYFLYLMRFWDGSEDFNYLSTSCNQQQTIGSTIWASIWCFCHLYSYHSNDFEDWIPSLFTIFILPIIKLYLRNVD